MAILLFICIYNTPLFSDNKLITFQDKLSHIYESTEGMSHQGKDGWFFIREGIRHVSIGQFWGKDAAKVSKAKKAKYADPLEAILDYHEQVKKQGIELILLPIPPKSMVYSDMLDEKIIFDKNDIKMSYHSNFYDILRKSGVVVCDLMEVFLEMRQKGQNPFCKTDSHWSPLGIDAAVAKVKSILKDKPWYVSHAKSAFSSQEIKVSFRGDLIPPNSNLQKETLSMKQVLDKNEVIKPAKDSPILVFGDSHTLIFNTGGDMHAKSCGFASQLALSLGLSVDVYGVKGSGARPARIGLYRKGKKNPNYIKNKKVLIWCFTAREFSESSGWGKIPLLK